MWDGSRWWREEEMLSYVVIHVGSTSLTPRPFGETKMIRLFFSINVSKYVLTRHLSTIRTLICLKNNNNAKYVNWICKVVFYPTRLDSSWWYVNQTAPWSWHIFNEGEVEKIVPDQALQEEDERNVLISGHLQHLTSKGETSGDLSNGSDDVSSKGDNDKV